MKKGFSAGFVAGFTTSELVHKLVKTVKESLKDMKISDKVTTVIKNGSEYVETAQLDPELKESEVDEFLKKA